MERKHVARSTPESELFKIPIEKYKECIMTEEKKKEILDIFMHSNNLRSKKEYKEIKRELHRACVKGDVELIKIYLGETIEDESKEMRFKIDKTNKTASLIKVNSTNEQLTIPRTVIHESTDYLISSININIDATIINFVEDSAVKVIYNVGMLSRVKEIYFPSNLKELKEGWRKYTEKLDRIIISPSNDNFIFKDDKYLLGKSDENQEEFDTLIFVRRNIETICIPSNIKIISSHAFHHCYITTKVEFQPNSNLQIIEDHAFEESNVKEFIFPSSVFKIGRFLFNDCHYLRKVEFQPDSRLQTIDEYTFAYSNIMEITIPSSVTKIGQGSFRNCKNLRKVRIHKKSNLQAIEKYAFSRSNIEEIYFPSSLKELKEGWCADTEKLNKIIISPSNDNFIFKDDKYLLGKSDGNQEEFDTLIFVRRDIE
ncbi:hypothetical protein M9Y10_005702 [Tritrichomonas musculus]|uniref:Leucine-rich repeat domain-containing protein n=1 Tax=Tritrichomonas musculus TaxID=1915356 RepID=A0ABR2JCV0_9EUKA